MKSFGGIGLFHFQERKKKEKELIDTPEHIRTLAEDNAELLMDMVDRELEIAVLAEDDADRMMEIVELEMKLIELEEMITNE